MRIQFTEKEKTELYCIVDFLRSKSKDSRLLGITLFQAYKDKLNKVMFGIWNDFLFDCYMCTMNIIDKRGLYVSKVGMFLDTAIIWVLTKEVFKTND